MKTLSVDHNPLVSNDFAPSSREAARVDPWPRASYRRRNEAREDIRCSGCHALLFKASPAAIAGTIEIKCRRCGDYNSLRPSSPVETAR